jgi:hypothetical protein
MSGDILPVWSRYMYTRMYQQLCAYLLCNFRTGASLHISEMHDVKQKQFTRVHKLLIIVISTLFNYAKSCYTCVRLFMSICLMSGNNLSVRSREMYTKIYLRLCAYMLCINSAIFERVLHCTFQSCMT